MTSTATPKITAFTFAPGLDLRAIELDGEPWFIAADVIAALDLSAAGTTLDGLDEEDKVRLNLGLRGRAPWVISEAGLYSLIVKSRKPAAKDFSRWVTKEVLPAIRKNGGYMTPQVAQAAVDDPAVFMAKALVIANETIQPNSFHLRRTLRAAAWLSRIGTNWMARRVAAERSGN